MDRLYQMKHPGRLASKLHHYGFGEARFMWWWWQDIINFGDWVGPELFVFRTNSLPILAPVYERPSKSTVHLAAGSILTGVRAPDTAVVWGSGVMDGQRNFAQPKEIRAVRGPLTRKRCLDQGYACPEVYGDPGILMSDIYDESDASEAADVGIIPHFQDREAAKKHFGMRDDVKIIDVRRPAGAVVADILSCRTIFSSSLHGLIVSHAFNRRALRIEFDHPLAGDGTKFHDHYMAMGFEAAPDPVIIGPDVEFDDLLRQARALPCPDVEFLRGPLRDACPF